MNKSNANAKRNGYIGLGAMILLVALLFLEQIHFIRRLTTVLDRNLCSGYLYRYCERLRRDCHRRCNSIRKDH